MQPPRQTRIVGKDEGLAFGRVHVQVERIDARELDHTVDHRPFDAAECGQGVAVQQHEVGVLAGFDRADTLADAQLHSGMQRDELQRSDAVHTGVAHALGGLLVEPTHHLVRVRVDRRQHAGVMHQGRRLRDRVVGLHLVAPPVGERGRGDLGLGQFVRDLVALENVLERRDLEAEALAHAHEHQDAVGAIAVAVHMHLAFEDADQRVEAEVATRRRRILARDLGGLVRLELEPVLLGAFEGARVDRLDAHPGARITTATTTTGALGVLAQGELDARQRTVEVQVRSLLGVPAQFEDRVLATDGVRGTVQLTNRRDAAGQCAVDADIVDVDRVHYAHFGRDRERALVDPALDGGVAVAIDDAGSQVLARTVEHAGAVRNGQACADRTDLAVDDEHVQDLGRPGGRVHGRALDQTGRADIEGRRARCVRFERVVLGERDGGQSREKDGKHGGTRAHFEPPLDCCFGMRLASKRETCS